jgi:THUMP domain-like
MNHEQARWLIEQHDLLQSMQLDSDRKPPPTRNAWQASLLTQQLELRRRAARRFPDGQRWFWTDRSLAQASDWWSARYKASLFPNDATVVDACCGAGADAVALGMSHSVIAIDQDPTLVLFANANLKLHQTDGQANGQAIVGEVPRDLPDQCDWLHLDPDRRPKGQTDWRLKDAEQFSPTLEQSLEMANRAKGAIIKLAPSTMFHPERWRMSSDSIDLTRCWLGNQSECRQQLLLTGKLAMPKSDTRLAVLCEPSQTPLMIRGTPIEDCKSRMEVGSYIYDCHPVLIASQLQTSWAETVGARPVFGHLGYYTLDTHVDSPWAQAFEVVEVLPWDQRRVRRWLKEHHIGEVEVKKRLVELDANGIQKQLRGAGDQQITLLITRIGKQTRAIAARRLERARSGIS